jgi:tripartite-type tricarboxylate transporter receptor subunit TctC
VSSGSLLPLGRRPLLGGALAAAASARLGRAQTAAAWAPNRPVTVVVPFSAGATTDLMARLIAGPMGRSFGQA